ncbi:MAG: glycosyltransferase family 39 protein [Saprospiraceae bacterium]
MDRPYLIRLLPFLYSVITLFYVYVFGKKFFSLTVGFLSAIVLLSSISFFNFGLQLRGYSLSMMLLIMLAFYSINYLNEKNKRDAGLMIILSCLAFYTVPVNIYPILGGFLFFFTKGIFLKYKKLEINSLECFKISAFLFSGLFLGFILYLPMFRQVFFNEYVISQKLFNFEVFEKLLPDVWSFFMGKKMIINIIFGIGILSIFSNKKNLIKQDANILLWAIFFAPFLISFVRGEFIPDRALSMLIPIFSLIIGIGIYSAIQLIPKSEKYSFLLAIPISIYCFFIFDKDVKRVDAWLSHALQISHRAQNLENNYYLSFFRPLDDVQYFIKNHYKNSEKVVVYDCEPHGFYNYMDKYQIKYIIPRDMDEYLKTKEQREVFMVARFPNEFKNHISQNHPYYEVEQLRSDFSYNNFFRLTLKKINDEELESSN